MWLGEKAGADMTGDLFHFEKRNCLKLHFEQKFQILEIDMLAGIYVFS